MEIGLVASHTKPAKRPQHNQFNDEELIGQYLYTNQNAYFETLYNRYVSKVYRRCLSLTKDAAKAEDFTQDIFMRVYGHIGKFKGNSSFSTWLYSISYNYCMDQLRRAKNKTTTSLDTDQEYHFTDSADYENVEAQLDQLARALGTLSPEEGRMLRLKYEDGMDIKEIASQMNLKDSAVKMRLKRSRDKVRRVYNEQLN